MVYSVQQIARLPLTTLHMRYIQTYVLWALYSVSSLILSIWIAWHLSAHVNFLYPLWYSVLKIDQTIAQNAPRHLYKKQFVYTTKQEHHRLFSELVKSIQNKGGGLAHIYFYSESGEQLGTLLSQNEITHLKDVSLFIDSLNWLNILLLIFSLLLLAVIFLLRLGMPTPRKLFVSVGVIIAMVTFVVFIIGPTKTFYWLHPIVFHVDHQWFFYYEESLMSMLMKAPVLFAPICMQLILFGLFIWGSHLLILKKWGGFKMV